MSTRFDRDNSINGTEANDGEGSTLGRDAGIKQPAPSRHHVTANQGRTKRAKKLNKLTMKRYLMSDFLKRGYRRMHNIWHEIGVFEITELKLAGQVLAIGNNGWLSEIEIEEIKWQIENTTTEEGRVTYVEEVEEENKQLEYCEHARHNNIAEIEEKIRRDNLGENQVRIAKLLMEELQAEKIEQPPDL